MENDKAVVIFRIHKKRVEVELEVPLFITANNLVQALNSAYDLDIDTENIKNCYLKSENPIALLRGNKTLREYGIRHGTIINYTE